MSGLKNKIELMAHIYIILKYIGHFILKCNVYIDLLIIVNDRLAGLQLRPLALKVKKISQYVVKR